MVPLPDLTAADASPPQSEGVDKDGVHPHKVDLSSIRDLIGAHRQSDGESGRCHRDWVSLVLAVGMRMKTCGEGGHERHLASLQG